MAPFVAAAFVEDISSVPDDGFDDAEFAEYCEGTGHMTCEQPSPPTKRLSGIVGKALSKCQSVIDKSSQVVSVSTHDGMEETCAVDHIGTAGSHLHRLHTDYNEIRNIVTGGEADAWYPASSVGESQPVCLGMVFCFMPVMPLSVPMTSSGANANHLIAPSLRCNATSNQVGNNIEQQTNTREAVRPSSDPALGRAPLQSASALFEPTASDQNEDISMEAALKTTLILRNIPFGANRSAVMNVLRSEGFANHVAFIYLPMDLRNSVNFGYAFVDFHSPKVAEQCKEKLEGFMGWGEPIEDGLELAWSETQGLAAHVQRYRNSPLMHASVQDELKPAIFKNSVRVAFPRPTKAIRAPRLRKNTKA